MAEKTSKTSQKTDTKTAAKEKKPFDVKAYYNEPVTVKLFKDNARYKDDVFVAVNGVGMLVPRGVEVKIPRKYAEALLNSEKQASFAIEYQTKLQNDAQIAESNI